MQTPLSDDLPLKQRPSYWTKFITESREYPSGITAFIKKKGVGKSLYYHWVSKLSVSTMYRILVENDQVQERRNILRHPEYVKPELLATGPKQVWSWDITKLKGPRKWNFYHLYVIIDIYSRYVVGWMIADRETGLLARDLIEETCKRQDIGEDHQLYIHADRSDMFEKFPERFVKGHPKVAELPSAVWINRPQEPNAFDTMTSITIISDSGVSVS